MLTWIRFAESLTSSMKSWRHCCCRAYPGWITLSAMRFRNPSAPTCSASYTVAMPPSASFRSSRKRVVSSRKLSSGPMGAKAGRRGEGHQERNTKYEVRNTKPASGGSGLDESRPCPRQVSHFALRISLRFSRHDYDSRDQGRHHHRRGSDGALRDVLRG